MILGLGLDVVENQRIAKIYARRGRRFLERVFTTQEIEYSLKHADPVPYLAARFAVKEAAVKALNLRESAGLRLKEVELAGRGFGKKDLRLHGRAREIAEQKGVRRLHVSLSHSPSTSAAVVILES